ncbi:MAG: hypothetical protein MHM6MM_001199 [Cercozoa sp. M6MM]
MSLKRTHHVPVMFRETLSLLSTHAPRTVFDGTLGGGGHASAFLRLPSVRTLFGMDRDDSIIEEATERVMSDTGAAEVALGELGSHSEEEAREHKVFVPCHSAFADIDQVLDKVPSELWPDAFLFDIGGTVSVSFCLDLDCLFALRTVSSMQLDRGERGFSIRFDAPLDMRMDTTQGMTALELIDELSELELANVIATYGEDSRSRLIAKAIKRAAVDGTLRTTHELRNIVHSVYPREAREYPGGHGSDCANRTFQALRIAVNDEMGQLQALLNKLPKYMKKGTRVGFLTFHSLECRLVKRAMNNWIKAGRAQYLDNASRYLPSDEEIRRNPRARSARLRVVEATCDPL